MIKVEHIEVFNFKGAIRGLRNPMNSWDKSDSFSCIDRLTCDGCPCEGVDDTCNSTVGMENVIVGKNDLDLMRRLYKAGTEHRKYLRQIFVSMDITAPLYWWKEADTYRIGVTANSCSTMHKIHAKEFELDDFSHEHIVGDVSCKAFDAMLESLNFNRYMFLDTKDTKVIVNVCGHSEEEYVSCVERLAECDNVDLLEINVSCPNVKEGGIAFGTDPKCLNNITSIPICSCFKLCI